MIIHRRKIGMYVDGFNLSPPNLMDRVLYDVVSL